MKKMKNILWIFAFLLIASSLVLAACQADQATPVEEDGEEEVMEDEPITLRVFAGNVGKELELTKAAADRYMEANPNVTVEVVDTPDFVEDRLGVYLQLFEAQSPEGDVFQIDVIWPGDLATHFVDLYDYGAEAVVGDHFDAIVENNTVDGKLVGLPWFTDAGLLYYRSDLLEKYGYDSPPATWEELEDMAQTIQEGERDAGNADFWGFVWQGNAYEGLTCDALEWVHSNGGGTIVSPDKVITVNNEAAIAAVDQAAGWVGTISPPGVTGFGEEEARSVWQAGNAAFMRNWPYAYSLGQADDSVIKDKFDVSPLPAGASGSGSATLGGWQLAVSKYSEHPEAAAELALYMGSADEQKIRAIEGSFNPTIKSLYSDEDVLEATPFFGSLYDVFINAVARPSTATAPNYAETSRIFFTGVHDVLTGESDAASAFEAMELDMVDLLGYETGEPQAMPEVEEMQEDLKVGLVTDVGEIDDKSFNQSAWEGVQLAGEEFGAEIDYIETSDAKDYMANIALFADNDFDIIVTVGFALGEATLEAAEMYPDIYFIGVDQFQGEAVENVVGLIFEEDKSGYMAGALAGLLTETDTVAAVLGTDLVPPVVAFKEGYESGVAYVNEDAEVISTYHPGGLDVAFTDPEWGATTARQALDSGADVVFGAGGKTGNGALIEVAGEEGAYCIGVDSDQWFTVPEAHPCLVSSAMKLITPGVFDLISLYQEGSPPSGNFVGEFGLAPFHDFEDEISQDVKDQLAEIREMLLNDELDTGYPPAE